MIKKTTPSSRNITKGKHLLSSLSLRLFAICFYTFILYLNKLTFLNLHFQIESSAKVCATSGLVCLSERMWYKVPNCKCQNLCESVKYIKLNAQYAVINYKLFLHLANEFNLFIVLQFYKEYSKMASFTIQSPNFRIKTDVVFDFDDLIGKNRLTY